MIPNELLAEELLQQAATELATVLNNSLPPSIECQHKFSNGFEEKMQSLVKGIGTTCYTVVIQDSMIPK